MQRAFGHGTVLQEFATRSASIGRAAKAVKSLRKMASERPWRPSHYKEQRQATDEGVRPTRTDLFHSCQGGVQSDDVCTEIAAVSAGILVATIGLELVVASVARIVLDKCRRSRIRGEKVAGWP